MTVPTLICTQQAVLTRFSCGRVTLNRLLELIDIPDFGDVTAGVSVGNEKSIRIADHIGSKRDLWAALCAAGWVIGDEAGLVRYREIRALLTDKHSPHPPAAALAALALEGAGATKHQIFKRLGGTFKTIGTVMTVIDRALGRPEREDRRSMKAAELPLDEFLTRYPQFTGLDGTCEDREFKGDIEPSPALLGRVGMMKSPQLEELTGLALMVLPGRLSAKSIEVVLRMLEHLDEVREGSAPALGGALLDRLQAVTLDNEFALPLPKRDEMNLAYGFLRSNLRAWCDEVPPARRLLFERLVPPPLPPTFSGAAEDLRDQVREARDAKRGKTAGPISKDREKYLNIGELRFRQIDRLANKAVAALRETERRLSAGEHVEFPVPVNDTYDVIRPDAGGIGNGSQTISVRIETAAALWEQCAAADISKGVAPANTIAWNWLSSEGKQRVAPRDAETPAYAEGTNYSPELERDLRVVYLATRPVRPGGEVVDPFWTTLFRSRLFDPDRDITPAERAERDTLVAAIGFDPLKAPCPGLLSDSSTFGKSLTRAYRSSVSATRFVFPVEEFRHSMAIGRVVMRPELMRGMRIGESSQARGDAGAFSFRKFNGKVYYYISVVPKMAHGRSRRMVLDPITVTAFDRVRAIAVERWFRADGQMPVRDYHFKDKKLPAARYLLANASRTLIYAEMNLYLRVLTIGVISSASHSYKYGFAAMLKRGKAPEQVLRRGLNHVPGSDHSDAYARFFTEHSIDAFIAEQQEESAKLELDFELLGL